LANLVGAPQPAQDLIRLDLSIGYDANAVAASNAAVLRQFPEPAVPTVVINGAPVDGESDWLDQPPGSQPRWIGSLGIGIVAPNFSAVCRLEGPTSVVYRPILVRPEEFVSSPILCAGNDHLRRN